MFDVTPVTSPRQTDCGPTCLKMLLAYYGQDVPLDTLIKECGVTVSGCTGGDLMRVGRAHGLTSMVAYRMSADELIQQDRPAIIHWRFCHWCVFCGQDARGRVVICNPDRGRFGMGRSDFERLYSGVALFNGEPEEYVTRATKAIANGEYFTHPNGELCKAIAPIANGAILTLNTNYTVTSVEAELAALNK